MRTINLPCYGITLILIDDWGCVSSDLHDGSNPAYNAIESLILAMAVAGIDVETPAMLEAIETAVEQQQPKRWPQVSRHRQKR